MLHLVKQVQIVFHIGDCFQCVASVLRDYIEIDQCPDASDSTCNDPTIGSYNHYHLSPNGIPSGIQRWYGLVYIIHIAGNPRIRPRE